MATKEFSSKVDAWLAVLLGVIVVVQVAALVFALYSGVDARGQMIMAGATVAVLLLVFSILLHTRYRIDNGVLLISSGPFRWKVPIAEIDSVEETRSPLSSPALSMDRLRIRYSGNKKVLVSPADKKAFLKALQQY